MRLCTYTPAHEPGCLQIFEGNTVPFFAARERASFLDYLKGLKPPCFYFVVQEESEDVLACGGMNFDTPNHLAYLRWDMVSRKHHRQGVGTFLALSRLSLICQRPEIQTVRLGTSQYSWRFYEKLGFSTRQITPNGIAPGLDEYLMDLGLEQNVRRQLERFGRENAISWEAP
jgi:RimJ/RimL family protein N-acetyltransferase